MEQRYIELVNDGVITAKLRGGKRTKMEAEFASMRKKVVSSFNVKTITAEIPMRAYSFARYKEVKQIDTIPSDLRQEKLHVARWSAT